MMALHLMLRLKNLNTTIVLNARRTLRDPALAGVVLVVTSAGLLLFFLMILVGTYTSYNLHLSLYLAKVI
jgi:hypothetical protein